MDFGRCKKGDRSRLPSNCSFSFWDLFRAGLSRFSRRAGGRERLPMLEGGGVDWARVTKRLCYMDTELQLSRTNAWMGTRFDWASSAIFCAIWKHVFKLISSFQFNFLICWLLSGFALDVRKQPEEGGGGEDGRIVVRSFCAISWKKTMVKKK